MLSGGLGPRAPMKGWGSLCWAEGLRTPNLSSRDPTLHRGVGPWDPHPGQGGLCPGVLMLSQGAWPQDPHPGLWLSGLGPPTTEPGGLAGVGVPQRALFTPHPSCLQALPGLSPSPVPPCLSPVGEGRAEPPPPGRAPPPRPTLVLPLTEQYLGLGVAGSGGSAAPPFFSGGSPPP